MLQTWVNTGWRCPSCGANLSPTTVSCPFHEYKLTVSPTTTKDTGMFMVHPDQVSYSSGSIKG